MQGSDLLSMCLQVGASTYLECGLILVATSLMTIVNEFAKKYFGDMKNCVEIRKQAKI